MGNLTINLDKSSTFLLALAYSELEKIMANYFGDFKCNTDYSFFFKLNDGDLEISLKSTNSAFLTIIKTQSLSICEHVKHELNEKIPKINIFKVVLRVSFK